MKTRDSKERIVVITGAASGIGEGAARWFAADGATAVLGGRDAAGLATLAADLHDVTIETRDTDVSDMAACEALVARAIARFGRIDVLVNDAGGDHLGKTNFARAGDERGQARCPRQRGQSVADLHRADGGHVGPARSDRQVRGSHPDGAWRGAEGHRRRHRVLAGDDAHYITGVNLPVDGGLSASNGQPALSRAQRTA